VRRRWSSIACFGGNNNLPCGNSVTVGLTAKLGLWHALTWDSCLVTLFDGAADLGTLAVDNDEVEKNQFTSAGTLDGVKIVRIVYVV